MQWIKRNDSWEITNFDSHSQRYTLMDEWIYSFKKIEVVICNFSKNNIILLFHAVNMCQISKTQRERERETVQTICFTHFLQEWNAHNSWWHFGVDDYCALKWCIVQMHKFQQVQSFLWAERQFFNAFS